MKGTILTTPSSNCLGTMTDEEGNTVDYAAGYITEISKGDVFEYSQVEQNVGDKEKLLCIIMKKVPK